MPSNGVGLLIYPRPPDGAEDCMPRDSSTLHVEDLAPDFDLETAGGERFALRQGLTSPLALVFIRGTW